MWVRIVVTVVVMEFLVLSLFAVWVYAIAKANEQQTQTTARSAESALLPGSIGDKFRP